MKKMSARNARDGQFVIDKGYIKTQATEAVTLFLAPVSGVYRAATGKASARSSAKAVSITKKRKATEAA